MNVLQSAFTVYDFSADPQSQLTAMPINLTTGWRHTPVLGLGILISGFTNQGGQVRLHQLTTGAVYATGLLPDGTADLITAGVFMVYGVQATQVVCQGEVVTYGVNDVMLDN